METRLESGSHFESYHKEATEAICMQHNGQCSVLVEITDTKSPEEEKILTDAAERSLSRLDKFFDGRFAEMFSGLCIKIGDDLVAGGAEALSEDNRIKADRQKMLLSLTEAETMLVEAGYLEVGDRTRVASPDDVALPGSSLEYELIHEAGHLLDEQTSGNARHRVAASESPTKYGREPDEWHDTKGHEAFAEGFAYMVYDAPVTEKMNEAVNQTIKLRASQQ